MPRTSRAQKGVFLVAGILNLIVGVIILGTAGIKGFNGTGGSDTQLFQLVAYTNIIMIVSAIISFLTIVKYSSGLILALSVLLILTGVLLTLFTLFLFGLINLVLGIIVLIVRRRVPKN